jgi:hypothetical protein
VGPVGLLAEAEARLIVDVLAGFERLQRDGQFEARQHRLLLPALERGDLVRADMERAELDADATTPIVHHL